VSAVPAQGFLCRDCLAAAPRAWSRCPECGSPRGLDLNRAVGLTLAHVDCDAFYASVEKRDDPSLKDRPLIVGGGGRRGVVSTACYLARIKGVRSAMPTAMALELCPEALVLPPDMAKYSAVAREIRALMFELTPLVEPLSIDEAFLDLSGCEATHAASAAEILARFARRVESEIGVTVSVGLSYCKFLAKLASDLDKPRGFAFFRRDEAVERLKPLPVGRLWGVGKVAEARLAKLGFATIGDLQRLDYSAAATRLGDDGLRLWRLSQGIDDRKVSIERDAKSLSAETTFETDVGERAELERVLLRLAEKLARRLKGADLSAGGVTLKLRTPDFKLRTRTRSGLPPTQMAMRLFALARGLLAQQPAGERYRLIGIGAADLQPGDDADAFDLAEGDRSKEKAREGAIDALREKFGAAAIQRGLAFAPGKSGKTVKPGG
jgi:DNA polymerase IV